MCAETAATLTIVPSESLLINFKVKLFVTIETMKVELVFTIECLALVKSVFSGSYINLLSKTFSRPADASRHRGFTFDTTTRVFTQGDIFFEEKRITGPNLICNRDEAGLSSGSDPIV